MYDAVSWMHGYFETKEVMTYDMGGTDVFLSLKLYTLLSTSSISLQYFTKLKVFTSTLILLYKITPWKRRNLYIFGSLGAAITGLFCSIIFLPSLL